MANIAKWLFTRWYFYAIWLGGVALSVLGSGGNRFFYGLQSAPDGMYETIGKIIAGFFFATIISLIIIFIQNKGDKRK